MFASSFSTVRSTSWARYLGIFALVASVGAGLLLVLQLRITSCSGYGYGPDAYLAQCAAPEYGDYEHGALGLLVEGKAIDHLQRAQVIVLGHSHALVGFSTPSTGRYFGAKGIPFYNASLSGEYSRFYDFLLPKLRLNAKVIVIDVALLLGGEHISSTGRFIIEQPIRSLLEYRIKQAWQLIHRHACSGTQAAAQVFCGHRFSTFRSVIDGSLIADYTRVYGSPLPKYPVARGMYAPLESESRIKLAGEFLSRHRFHAACTILTAIPTGIDLSDLARTIAEALNTRYINPLVGDLTTIDGAHLDTPSALAWSKQFWTEATPIVDRCVLMGTEPGR